MTKPTDEEILAAVASGYQMMTYVIRNTLAWKHNGLETAWVRRRLMALEKTGMVKRAPTSYAVQICWAIATKESA